MRRTQTTAWRQSRHTALLSLSSVAPGPLSAHSSAVPQPWGQQRPPGGEGGGGDIGEGYSFPTPTSSTPCSKPPPSVPSGGEAHAEADRVARVHSRGGGGGRGGPTDGQAITMAGESPLSSSHTHILTRPHPLTCFHLTPSYALALVGSYTPLLSSPTPYPPGSP